MSPVGLDWRQHLADDATRAFHQRTFAPRLEPARDTVDAWRPADLPAPERHSAEMRKPVRAGGAVTAGLVAALVAAIGVAGRQVWAPDPLRLNLHLAERVGQYREDGARYVAGSLGCPELARSYAAADEARMRAAVGFARLGDRALPVHLSEFDRLSAEMSRVDGHFDSAGCVRP